MVRIEVEEGTEWLTRLSGAWEELLLDSKFPTPFHTREWLSSWSQTLGRRKRIFLASAYEGSDLVGVIPMVGKIGIAGGYRSMAIGPSDYLHPVLRNGSDAYPILLERLLENGNNAVDFQQVREEILPLSNISSLAIFEQATCLSLDLPNSYDAYLQNLGKSLRTDCKRAEPEYLVKNELEIISANEENIAFCLDAFFELHASRWRSRGQPGAFLGRERFHRHWARPAIQSDLMRLQILTKSGQPIAAIYGMKFNKTVFFYQAGMNPQYKSLSAGTILLADLIRKSIDEGCTSFDFLRGDEPYKRRWKPQNSYQNKRLLYLPSGVRGPILEQVQRVTASAEKKLRDRLEGKSLGSKRPHSGSASHS